MLAPFTISMVADPASGSAVGQGKIITYTITITNGATAESTAGNGFIRAFDTSPQELLFQFNPAFPTGVVTQPGAGSAWGPATITPNGNGTNQFTIYAGDGIGGASDTFAANQTVVLKVDALVLPTATPGSTKTNVAFYEQDSDGNGVDEVFIGSANVTHTVAPPVDLAISKYSQTATPPATDPLHSVVAGGASVPLTSLADLGNEGRGNISYVLTVSNIGPNNAINAVIEDEIPGGPAHLVNAPALPSSPGSPVAGPVTGQPIIPAALGVTSVFLADDTGGAPVGTATAFAIGFHYSGGLLVGTPGNNTAINPAYTVGVLPAGFQARIAYRTRVDASAEPNSIVGNEARIYSTGAEDIDAGNNASLTTQNVVIAKADLGVTLVTSNPTPTAGGAAFSYTIVVTNNGPSDAHNIVVTDALPPGVIFQNFAIVNNPSIPGFGLIGVGPPIATNGTVTFTGNLPGPDPISGTVSTSTITIVAQIVANVASGVRTNTVIVASDTQETTPNVAPNTASVQQSIVVDAPLSVTIAGPATVNWGDIFTYHIVVLNGGSSTALNATISDPLPPNTTFLNMHGTGAFDSAGSHNGGVPGTVTLAAVDIPSGISTLDITVRLAPDTIATTLANTVTITTAGTGTIAVGTSTTTATIRHPDEFESNNTLAAASVLGSVPEITLRDLTIDPDADFFQITAHDTGLLLVNVQFSNVNGNVNLEILDARSNVIATSSNATGLDEHLVIPVVSQQRYFVHVFGVGNATTFYTLELENFAAPEPREVTLDRTDDSGRDLLDNVTFRTTQLRYYVQSDLSDFALQGIPILTAAQAAGGVTPGAAVRVFDNGVPVGYADPVSGTNDTIFVINFDADLTRFAAGSANAAGPAGYLGFSNFIKAAVTIFDGQKSAAGAPIPAVGRTQLGTLLTVLNDNTVPLAPLNLDLLASSDGGQFSNDNVTLVNALAISGVGEANTHVVLRANGLIVGEGTVGSDASDGILGNGLGAWEITTEPLIPSATPYLITATLEDLAGNVGPSSVALHVLIDPEGPQVKDVYITGHGPADAVPFNLFGGKSSPASPTPLVNGLTIQLQDLPNRDAAFFANYFALNADASSARGNFQVVGDINGVIAIQDVIVTNNPVVNGQPATASIRLVFAQPLPDDRFTLTIKDSVLDPAGNGLDGESNAAEPSGAPNFPSGNGLPGGSFVARFTVDSRAELGSWASGSVYVDTNGNYTFDPTNADATNRDITYLMGFTSDNIFAGNFVSAVAGVADGFDKLAAYGKVGTSYRWLIDTNNDGVPEINIVQPLFAGVTNIGGTPVAGNFDGNAANGDEVALKVGNTWLLDTNHDFKVDLKLAGSNMSGLPITGDFDGDGKEDLGAWADNKFTIDFGSNGLSGNSEFSFTFGFASVRERPVASDFDGDGITDLGLWVPDRAGVGPWESAEWYLFISNNQSILTRNAANGGMLFKPTPFGSDQFAQFGDEWGLPIAGNFDPPITSAQPTGSLTNSRDHSDVDNDGSVSPIDALLIINRLNSGDTSLPPTPFTHAPFVDVNGDGICSPVDALMVINRLNSQLGDGGASGEGEAADAYFSDLGSTSAQDGSLAALLALDDNSNARKK
ncbi:MAG: dockerin type I domain-containing protein [Pirellulaceae bacterium]